MIGWIKRKLKALEHAALVRECVKEGHYLVKKGEMNPATMGPGGVPLVTGPADFWIYGCACGYNEVDVPNKKPYRRSWDEAEGFKKEGEYSVKTEKAK